MSAQTRIPAPDVVEGKVVVLGSQGVGKTSMVSQYVNHVYSPDVRATLGAAFLTKTLTLDRIKLKLQIWDTAGQERFRSMTPLYYRDSDSAILVFDITSPDSFASLKSWVGELQKNADRCTIMVVGNKKDLGQHRRITKAQAEQFASGIGASYFEVSAKDDSGLDELFVEIARKMLSKHQINTSSGTQRLPTIAVTEVSTKQDNCCY